MKVKFEIENLKIGFLKSMTAAAIYPLSYDE